MQKSREFAEKRQTVLSSGPNCLSFAPIAGILERVFFENGQFSYALMPIAKDSTIVFSSSSILVYEYNHVLNLKIGNFVHIHMYMKAIRPFQEAKN